MLSTSLRKNSLTAVVDNKVYNCDSTHPKWEEILDAVRANDEKTLVELIDIKKVVVDYSEGRVNVRGGQVFFDDYQLHGTIVDRLLGFVENNISVAPMAKFIERLMSNPSKRAVNELYTFLERKNLPLTPRGTFLAYKGLRGDYYSVTGGYIQVNKGQVDGTGHIYNGVGEEIECERRDVCDDKEVGCSDGLHAGSLEYATGFGTKTVIVEIDPKDVVSVPTDCECQKLRTCAYKVVGEYERPLQDDYCDEYDTDEDVFDMSDVDDDVDIDALNKDIENILDDYDTNADVSLN